MSAEPCAPPRLDAPTHPGQVVAAWLTREGWTQKRLAEALHRSEQAISDLVTGRKGLSLGMALDLEQVARLDPSLLLRLNADHQLYLARRKRAQMRGRSARRLLAGGGAA